MAQTAHVREAIATARIARHELGLGLDQPVHDLLLIVEETADVPGDPGPRHRRGRPCIVRRDQAFIFLNGSEAVTRQRFTLAHELGHHRLGHRAVVDGTETVEGRTTDPVEQQANAFAGEFLAPEQAVRNWMDAHDHPLIDLAVLVRIAAWFGISAPAAYVRLVEAEVLQRPTQRRQLKRQLDQGQHRGAEKMLGLAPVEDQLAQVQRAGGLPRLPVRLRDNALAAYAGGLIDIDRLALALRRERATVERLVAELRLVPAAPEPDW